jgi:hypothetical protein
MVPQARPGAAGRGTTGHDAARLGTYVRVVKPEEFVGGLSESFDDGV